MTLLGVHYLLEGELALHRLAFCLWLCLIEIEDHDGAVGELCWEFEALWGGGFDELAAGAAVAYCQDGFNIIGAHEISERAYHTLLQCLTSLPSEGD